MNAGVGYREFRYQILIFWSYKSTTLGNMLDYNLRKATVFNCCWEVPPHSVDIPFCCRTLAMLQLEFHPLCSLSSNYHPHSLWFPWWPSWNHWVIHSSCWSCTSYNTQCQCLNSGPGNCVVLSCDIFSLIVAAMKSNIISYRRLPISQWTLSVPHCGSHPPWPA